MSASQAAYGFMHVILSKFFVTLPKPQPNAALKQQIHIVTGSNVGLGLETSRHLLRLGVSKLIMAVRDSAKGEAARKELLKSTGREDASVEVWPLDMDSYASVQAFARRASADLPRLDGVLANAGLATTTFRMSEDNEKTLTVNVVSTFLLYFLLLPKMRESAHQTGFPCRFVIPNSALHYTASTKELGPSSHIFARLNDPDKADMPGRYPLSKLLVVWLVREIAAQQAPAQKKGSSDNPILNTPNPSFCKSELTRENDTTATRVVAWILARTTEEGSRTLYHGLISGEESHGEYLTNCHVQRPARHVLDKQGQEIQHAVFNELVEKLEAIQPGVTGTLKN